MVDNESKSGIFNNLITLPILYDILFYEALWLRSFGS